MIQQQPKKQLVIKPKRFEAPHGGSKQTFDTAHTAYTSVTSSPGIKDKQRVGGKDRLQTSEKLQQSRSMKPVAAEATLHEEEGDDAEDVTSREGKTILL
jgi:hypothetical protein